MNIFDSRHFKGSTQAEYGGAYHVGPPEIGPDLKAMGFNLVSYANNHTLDWGLEGMRETCRVLDQAESSTQVWARTWHKLAQLAFRKLPAGAWHWSPLRHLTRQCLVLVIQLERRQADQDLTAFV